MIDRSLPWWRRALTFALDGIRSGFGIFRRNEESGAKQPTSPQPALASRVSAVQNSEESRVNPSSPEPENATAATAPAPQAAEADAAHEAAPVAEPTPAAEALAAEPMAAEPGQAEEAETPTVADSEDPAATEVAAVAEEYAAPAGEVQAETTPGDEAALKPAAPAEADPAPPEPAAAETGAATDDDGGRFETATADKPAVPEAEQATAETAQETTPGIAPAAQPVTPTLPFAEKSAERTTAEKVAAALKAREARGEDANQSPFSVIVNQVYDGPLDLLLDLIRKQDIDIYDIPIAKITAQFLAYVNNLRSGDVDVAGEFIYTAALLIHIKSKMLLPRAPAGPEDTSEDPRRELVERLLEHERFKNAAQMLYEKQMLEAATWTNPGMRDFQEDAGAEAEIAADTTDLVRVFSSILERARNRPVLNLEEDSVTVGQMIQFLTRRLTMEDKPVALRRLLSHTNSERALIAMFLALLELVRLQGILLRQDRHFSEIFIKKHTGFEALMNQGLNNARDDWR